MIIEDEVGKKHDLDMWKRIVVNEFVNPMNSKRRSWDVYLEEMINELPHLFKGLDGEPQLAAPQFCLIASLMTEQEAMRYVEKLPKTTQEVDIRRNSCKSFL
jgi:hypothetical protein